MSRSFQWNLDLKVDSAAASAAFDKYWADAISGSYEAKAALNKALGGEIVQQTTLTIDADTRQFVQGTKTIFTALDQIEGQIKKIEQTQLGSVTSLRQQLATLTQQRDALNQYNTALSSGGQILQTQNSKWTELNSAIGNVRSQLNEALGIQQGSVTALREQAANAQELLNKTAPYKTALDSAGNSIQVANSKYAEQKAALQEIKTKLQEAEGVQKGSVNQLKQQLATQTEQLGNIRKYDEAVTASGRKVKVITEEWKQGKAQVDATNAALRQASSIKIGNLQLPPLNSILQLGTAFGQVAIIAQTVTAAFQAIAGAAMMVVERVQNVQKLTLTLESFGLSAKEADNTLKQAKATALTYGASLDGVEQAYRRITPAVIAAGGSIQDADKSVAAVVARTTTLGLTTEETSRYITAFTQVMGKGKLQSEELNQQLAELDPALRSNLSNYLASEHGITSLEEAMKDGAVTASMFRDFMIEAAEAAQTKLAGGIGEVQARINELNVAQIQNITNTLNAISLESLSNTFAGLGRELAGIQLLFSQWFSALTTQFPLVNQLIGGVAQVIGFVLRGALVGVLGAVNLLVLGLEAVLTIVDKVIQAFFKIPGVKPAIDAIGNAFQWVGEKVAQSTDFTFRLGDGIAQNRAKTDLTKTAQEQLNERLNQGKITQEEYNRAVAALKAVEAAQERKQFQEQLNEQINVGIEKTKQRINELQREKEELKNAHAQRMTQLDAEAAKIKIPFEERIRNLESEKLKVDELIQQTNDRIENEKARIKEPYEERIAALEGEKAKVDEVIAKINEKYDIESGRIRQLSLEAKEAALTAQQYELQELELKRQKGDLTAAESARLDAQIKQKELSIERSQLEIEKETELAGVKGEQSKIQAEIVKEKGNMKQALNGLKDDETELRDLQKEQRKINQEIREEKSKLANALAPIKKEQAELKQAYKEQVTAINEAISAQKKQLDNYDLQKKELAKVKGGVDEVGTSLQKLSSIKVNITRTDQRATGGPVTAGRSYTVNELGKEAFLSRTGKLSMINKPAYGTWRAPSSGIVIPAHITKELVGPNNNLTSRGQQATVTASRVTRRRGEYLELARSQNTMAMELGKLSQAVAQISRKEWEVNLNVGSGNPLLNRIKKL